jgi:hypothetical protein
MRLGLALEGRMAMSSSKSKLKSLFNPMQPWSEMEFTAAAVTEHFFAVAKRTLQFATQELRTVSFTHDGRKSNE